MLFETLFQSHLVFNLLAYSDQNKLAIGNANDLNEERIIKFQSFL